MNITGLAVTTTTPQALLDEWKAYYAAQGIYTNTIKSWFVSRQHELPFICELCDVYMYHSEVSGILIKKVTFTVTGTNKNIALFKAYLRKEKFIQ